MSVKGSARRAFLDTNIFIYAVDITDKTKNIKANALVGALVAEGRLAQSSQTLREFLNVHSKPNKNNLSLEDALAFASVSIEPYVQNLETPEFIRSALLLKVTHNIGFYDALILQAAIELGCGTLYSEDFQNGREYSGVKIVNPFL